jgi:hypothetical protein
MPINDVRNTVLAIANKNNYGYISPQDFNLYAQQAQMDVYEDYFYQYNNWINRENSRTSGTGYANIVKSLEEVIDSFSAEAFLSQLPADLNLSNKYQLPADYYLINKLFYYPNTLFTGTNTVVNAFKLTDSTKTFISNPSTMVSPPIGSIIVNNTTGQQCYVTAVDNATTLSISSNIMNLNNTYTIYSANNITEVERVNQNKIFLLTSSNLTAPTTQYPAYVLGGASINVATPNAVIGNTVDVYPSTIRQQYAIKVQYIRYPLPPQWTYTSLVSGEPLFNPGSTSYQDFELPLSDEAMLVAKICQYVGIEIREADVYKFGSDQEAMETQESL